LNNNPPTTLRKGDVVKLRVASLAVGGDGISKDEGRPVFVAFAAPGDLIETELFDVRKDFARGKILKVLEAGEHRTKPPCALFGVCGGCQLQHITYAEQLNVKRSFVQQATSRIGGIDENLVMETIPAVHDLHYRNKVQFPVRNPKNSDRLLAGYYKADSHELVNIKHCPVQPELIDSIMEFLKTLFEEEAFRAYDEKTKDGLLRHINARFSFSEQKALMTFVLNITETEFFSRRAKTLKHKLEMIAKDLMAEIPEVAGVSVNFNSAHGNKILGRDFLCIGGAEHIEERLQTNNEDAPQRLKDGIRYRLHPGSFFQVNSEQAVRLFELVRDAVTDGGKRRPGLLIDAYAGVGAMALWVAHAVDRVIAIEEHEGAIQDGMHNATLNDITNIDFQEGSTEQGLAALIKDGVTPDVVLVDPPRKGLSPQAVESLLTAGAERIVYVSCNPATLARDLKLLSEGLVIEKDEESNEQKVRGYKTKQIQPIDIFPHTHHVESVTILERHEGHGPINLEETR
jgi:23S rRNA (uracil1939-C5)-methyltransferase